MDITKYYGNPDEKPLDIIKPDGGFFGIFRTVGCIGDSLSSGEMESLDENGNRGYHDYFEYSWGQYMARAAGNAGDLQQEMILTGIHHQFRLTAGAGQAAGGGGEGKYGAVYNNTLAAFRANPGQGTYRFTHKNRLL